MSIRESLEVLSHTVKEMERSGNADDAAYFIALVKAVQRSCDDMKRDGTWDAFVESLSPEDTAKLNELRHWLGRLLDDV